MKAHSIVAVAVLGCSGCLVSPTAQPVLDAETVYATQFNHRGMVQNETGVVQPSLRLSLPVAERLGGGGLSVGAFGNVDLRNDTGDAWFPNGHAGRFSETDYDFKLTRRFGRVDVTFGLATYVLHNGQEFLSTVALSERGETKELFLQASSLIEELYEIEPFAIVHEDFDEAKGTYIETGVLRSFEVLDDLTADARFKVAYGDAKHALWTYGDQIAGVSDARLEATLFYQLDPATQAKLSFGVSTIIDRELQRWFDDQIGISRDNFWVTVGFVWRFPGQRR